MVVDRPQSLLRKHLARGRNQAGNLKIRATEKDDTFRREVVEVVPERFASQYVIFRQTQSPRCHRRIADGIDRNDRVVLLRRAPDKAAPFVRDQMYLRLVVKVSQKSFIRSATMSLMIGLISIAVMELA